MYIDNLPDRTLLVSNFGDARIFRVDVEQGKAELFVEGSKLGMKDAGNCVVDDEGFVWINEVKGCRIWRFDHTGTPALTLGKGEPVFQIEPVGFAEAGFNWVYDIRKGPDGNIYVLDSKNFAVRMIDIKHNMVRTLAGTGKPGYAGDEGDARNATFGSDTSARFDGPISLSLDEYGNVFVGDRMNHVVRIIERQSGVIHTIAGNPKSVKGLNNNLNETNPSSLNLPEISSMEYHNGRLLVPTDLTPETGDLAILQRHGTP
jgi:sugar lactone lactonase YvrE